MEINLLLFVMFCSLIRSYASIKFGFNDEEILFGFFALRHPPPCAARKRSRFVSISKQTTLVLFANPLCCTTAQIWKKSVRMLVRCSWKVHRNEKQRIYVSARHFNCFICSIDRRQSDDRMEMRKRTRSAWRNDESDSTATVYSAFAARRINI